MVPKARVRYGVLPEAFYQFLRDRPLEMFPMAINIAPRWFRLVSKLYTGRETHTLRDDLSVNQSCNREHIDRRCLLCIRRGIGVSSKAVDSRDNLSSFSYRAARSDNDVDVKYQYIQSMTRYFYKLKVICSFNSKINLIRRY